MQQLNPEGGKMQLGVGVRGELGDVDSGEAEGLLAQGTEQARTASG